MPHSLDDLSTAVEDLRRENRVLAGEVEALTSMLQAVIGALDGEIPGAAMRLLLLIEGVQALGPANPDAVRAAAKSAVLKQLRTYLLMVANRKKGD